MREGPPQKFSVKANTLVIADTRGFHNRSEAAPSTGSVAIYANLRKHPFAPAPY